MPSPPGRPPGLPAPAPRSRPLLPLSPHRGTRHCGRQLLRGAWARPAGMPAALLLTMPTGRTAQGLAPVLPGAGEPVLTVLAGSWRGITIGSQASWATCPPACLLRPAAAPAQPRGAPEGGRWWANPSSRRGVQGQLVAGPGPGGGGSERKLAALTRPGAPAPAPAGSAGSPLGKSGSGATRARPPSWDSNGFVFTSWNRNLCTEKAHFLSLFSRQLGPRKLGSGANSNVYVYICVCVCTHMCAWMCKHVLCVCRHTRASLHVYMCARMCAWMCKRALWVCACGCSHPSDKQCSGTSWVSYNSTPFRHCLPRHRSDPCLRVQSHKTVLPPQF